ncbi:uncharacterized protein LOC117644723 [Thrips palmi]|uniref:Uncharacterized protein LOC117644723 n=1 Tax=Thrips palmi TaxID=161013 RepID=A0A6P8Z0Z1_THRPL|nr:uncharacterized protein LOC117644723 [Thrips palmi]
MSRARESPYTALALQQVGLSEAKALVEGKRARLSTVTLKQWATLPPTSSEQTSTKSSALAGLTAWLWSVPEGARAQLHGALHAVSAVMKEQHAEATQTDHDPMLLDHLVEQAMGQAVALLGVHERERAALAAQRDAATAKHPKHPKTQHGKPFQTLHPLMLSVDRCPGLASPWSCKSAVPMYPLSTDDVYPSTAMVSRGPLDLAPVCPSTHTSLLITEQEDDVLVALESMASVGSAALVAMDAEAANVLVDEVDADDGERDAEQPPSITCESLDSEACEVDTHSSQNLEPGEVQAIAICTMLDQLNDLLDNFKERPENRRRSLLQTELERRLTTLFDQTRPQVGDLVPTAKKFACSVSYWMETYLLRAEDKLAPRKDPRP